MKIQKKNIFFSGGWGRGGGGARVGGWGLGSGGSGWGSGWMGTEK